MAEDVAAYLAKYGLASQRFGRRGEHHEKITSTNDRAHELARAGALEGTVVMADCQTAGRGRLGREWNCAPGAGISMSVVLRPNAPANIASSLTMLGAVAVAKALERTSNIEAGIKWPNDIVIHGRKLCGILCESKLVDGRAEYVILGIGVNVNQKPGEFPPGLVDAATSVRIASGQTGGRWTKRQTLACAILQQLEREYDRWVSKGPAPMLASWRKRSATLGREVTVKGIAGSFTGIAEDVDEEGALWVRTAKGRQRVLAGDVTIGGYGEKSDARE
ncbi:MAG: biotin--[acetyl-CoA-carboxylase] ligase [Chloroflexota bacterium]